MAAPEQGPLLAEAVCEYFNYSSTCYDEYSVLALGSVFTQVVSMANVGGYDGQVGVQFGRNAVVADLWSRGIQESVLQI